MKTRISQNKRIVSELSNDFSRKIVFSIIKNAKSGQEIARETGLSLSTVYQKITILLDLDLIYEDHIESTDKGKTICFYKSSISMARILIRSDEPRVELIKN